MRTRSQVMAARRPKTTRDAMTATTMMTGFDTPLVEAPLLDAAEDPPVPALVDVPEPPEPEPEPDVGCDPALAPPDAVLGSVTVAPPV